MTRHQLKEQDEITTSLERFTELVVARKKELLTGLIVLVVLVLAIFGWRFYSSRRNAAVQAQLSQAISAFNDTVNIKSDKERYEKTIAEAQKTRPVSFFDGGPDRSLLHGVRVGVWRHGKSDQVFEVPNAAMSASATAQFDSVPKAHRETK
jgi:hypothetical protein